MTTTPVAAGYVRLYATPQHTEDFPSATATAMVATGEWSLTPPVVVTPVPTTPMLPPAHAVQVPTSEVESRKKMGWTVVETPTA